LLDYVVRSTKLAKKFNGGGRSTRNVHFSAAPGFPSGFPIGQSGGAKWATTCTGRRIPWKTGHEIAQWL